MNENRPTRPIGRGPLMTFFTRNQRSEAPRRNWFTSRYLEEGYPCIGKRWSLFSSSF